MANLFFIHTPLQLMIAQMIIEQEKLKDNVMLCGYVDDNRHFLQLYDLIRIDEMWKAMELMEDVARWAVFSRKKPFSGGLHAYKRYCYICGIIKKYRIDTLYLGDMWNASCQLSAMNYHCKGLKICFFEEGNGHYILPYGYGMRGSCTNKVYALLMDAFYYLPLYGVRMGYISYWKGITLKDIPMDARYSVVPFYHEKFDIQLTAKPLLSEKLVRLITNEVRHVGQKVNTLLMTSPIYEWMGDHYKKDEDAYVKTIIEYMKSIGKGICIHIKFHPREKEYIRKRLLMELAKSNIDYIILGSELNIPVEYYLQYIHYEKIIVFLSSSSFYNGYLFPKVKFVSILENYYNNCKAVGSQSIHLLEPLLKEIPKE